MRHAVIGLMASVVFAAPVAHSRPAIAEQDVCSAAREGRTADLSALLARGVKLDIKCENGDTPLMLAAYEGHLETVRLLISHGAKVNEVGSVGSTALADAAAQGHIEVMQALLDAHAAVELRTGGLSPLPAAARGCQLGAVKFLLAHGAKVDAGEPGWSALLYAAEVCALNHSDIVQTLLAAGANVNQKDGLGQTALMLASGEGAIDVVRILLDQGAQPNASTPEGKTALMYAARAEYAAAATVRELLAKRANPAATDKDGNTALSIARAKNQAEVIAVLEQAVASTPQGPSKRTETPSGENASRTSSPAPDQPLGELGRRARKPQNQASTRVLTNEDLQAGTILARNQNAPAALQASGDDHSLHVTSQVSPGANQNSAEPVQEKQPPRISQQELAAIAAAMKKRSPAELKGANEAIFLNMMQDSCTESLHRYCGTVDELIEVVQKEGAQRGFSPAVSFPPARDPRRDPNYDFRFSVQDGKLSTLALPRHSGLASFLVEEGNVYVSSSTPATRHDALLGESNMIFALTEPKEKPATARGKQTKH